MTLPQDLNLISQLLSEKITDSGDLNTLITPGFYFVTNNITNTPNNLDKWCHVIVASSPTKRRTLQIYLSDLPGDNEMYLYYRQKVENDWTPWRKVARDDGQTYATMPQVTAEVTRILTTALPNSTTKIDDQTTLAQWYGMFSYQDGARYKSYSVIPSEIIAQQTPTSDMTYYFKFVLPAKPEYITDDRPSPLGIGTNASNLHAAVNTLSDKVMLSRDSNTVIEAQLTIDNLIYSACSSATGLFTDKSNSMFIATNTDQEPDSPEVGWGQTVIMSLRCHEVMNNPFQGE